MSYYREGMIPFLVRAAELGDVVNYRIGFQQTYLVNHPALIGEILVAKQKQFVKGPALAFARRVLGDGLLTSEGAFHLRQRRLVQPAFHRDRLAGYAAIMAAYSERTSGRWEAGMSLDASAEMLRLTLAIVGKALFDADVETSAGGIGSSLTELIRLMRFVVVPFASVIERLPLPVSRRYHRARARLEEIVERIVAERRANGADPGDLLSTFLLARDEAHEGMTDVQVRDEILTILLAGHETVANALAWTWLLLSEHPLVEARLHAELDEVLGDGEIRLEDLPRLVYLDRVIAESLRRYPTVWTLTRRATAEVELGGYALPAGSVVLASQYVSHHDARWFPNPTEFDPDRWTDEMRAALPKHAYFPFGAGVRNCVGESFARMEFAIVVATIARRWRIRVAPGHALAMWPRLTLRPRFGIPAVLERRRGK